MANRSLDTLGYSVTNVNMKDIKRLKKGDFIEIAKKLKLNDLRNLFNFTHMNIETGEKLKAIEGVNCMDCFAEMRNDEHSSIDENYCRECLDYESN